MPSLELSPKVRKACHVLALDDERNTFHPVLWDESKEPQDRTHTRDERISQVWFAGMHANVGGGYPDDAVALVSLKWMSDQASAHGLQFVPNLIEHHTAKRDPIGRIYDSRAGLKGYYRYNPRRIEFLTNGQAHERGFFNRRWPRPNPTVSVERVKIHESVFTRIASAPDAYAPIVLPSRYAVVMDDGRIVEGAANPYETPEASAARGLAQEQAWNLVWWRRIAYFATVFASAWLVARPFAGGPTGEIAAGRVDVAARAILAVGDYVPDLASRWINYFATVPSELLLGGGVIVALMAAGGRLRGAICSTMRRIWIASTSGRPTALRHLASPSGFVYALRRQPAYQGAFAVLRRHVLPTVFGVGVLAMLVGIVNRAPFEIASGMGTVCRPDALGPSAAAFRTDALCTATGYRLDAARRYRITVTPDPSAPWRDLQIPVPSPGGFATWSPDLSLSQRLRFAAFLPFRRVWTAHWYAPVAQVGEQGWDYYPIAGGSAEITARTSGPLYIFVNDVIFPIGPFTVRFGWSAYYSNNQGVGHVSVCRVEGDECVPVASAAMGAAIRHTLAVA